MFTSRIKQRNGFHFGKWKYEDIYKIPKRQLYSGDIDSTSTVMFCVKGEILSLEMGGAMYRLSLPKRKYSKDTNI